MRVAFLTTITLCLTAITANAADLAAPRPEPVPNAFGCHWYEGDDLYTCIFTVLDGLCDGCISGCQGNECGEEESPPAKCEAVGRVTACAGDLGVAMIAGSYIAACGEDGCFAAMNELPLDEDYCWGDVCAYCDEGDDRHSGAFVECGVTWGDGHGCSIGITHLGGYSGCG